jgi:hypothetical protein
LNSGCPDRNCGPDDLAKPIQIVFETTEVEIYGGKRHPIFWDWKAGDALPTAVGNIDDTDPVSGKPEYHVVAIPPTLATKGQRALTILINPEVPAGLKDDFVLRKIHADREIGTRIGW